MAYVPVPKDLNAVKTKAMFNLTKRQFWRRCCNRYPPFLPLEIICQCQCGSYRNDIGYGAVRSSRNI